MNDLGETPLMTAIADGVTDDKLALMLAVDCHVHGTIDYLGLLRKATTSVLAVALCGRTSMVSILVSRAGTHSCKKVLMSHVFCVIHRKDSNQLWCLGTRCKCQCTQQLFGYNCT